MKLEVRSHEVRSHEVRSKKSEVMKLEVRNHEVRSSNELPGLPYIYVLLSYPCYQVDFAADA